MENIVIRTTSQTPIYQQLYDQISSQIINGDLVPDTPLPSIRVMARELRVSIITIKKTWELLEQNDFIYTVIGKGSYVQKSTQSTLNKKKIDAIKQTLTDTILLSKQMDISKEQLLQIVEDVYDKK